MKYVPRPSDIDWTVAQFQRLNDRAIWGVPSNRSIYRLDKKASTLELLYGPEMGCQGNLFEQLAIICSHPRINLRLIRNVKTVPRAMVESDFGLGKLPAMVDRAAREKHLDEVFQAQARYFASQLHVP